MESTYKTRLTSEQLDRIVQQHFNTGIQEYKEMIDGWANHAYFITKKDGQKVVLKIAPSNGVKLMRCEQQVMVAEVEALRLVAELQDVPVPRVLAYDPSLTLVPAEYFIMEYMPGTPYNKVKDQYSAEEQESIEQQLGAYNRRINEIKGEKFGYFSSKKPHYTTWKEAFLCLMDDMLTDSKAAGVDFAIRYEELERLIQEKSDVLDDVKEPVLVHWDLWDGNVFVEAGKITAIIDFERSLWADPLMEHYFSHFNNTPGFLKGYGRTVTTDSERKRRSLYDLYFDLALRIECPYRQYDNKEHIQWAIDNLEEGIKRFQSS
ncbi:aminoglycoside phosphotransferase family protein [Paenibacillus sp. ALJ109b]|uniref:aminoglycoside phosphotransferase family protein n=1 Tax=Paenibacillus sp. ALJ109b TaxID=2709068 RepID=UPI0013D6979B|nr:aminoglycoside phosphotransferase family protein [Paenibacillus sp. ALJ109b]NEU64608.1 aminoglycoside phosphotransferase family protein [Paenibacillus sp. ALJ109b]